MPMTKTYYQPLGANEMPKFAGPATFMRLPARDNAEGLDACFVGVPFDMGSSNRVGARFGPRQIRMESTPIRPYNMSTRAAPFDSLSVADIGDVAVNPYNLKKSIEIIEAAYDRILAHECKPLTLGGRPHDRAADSAGHKEKTRTRGPGACGCAFGYQRCHAR